jgi:TRAP-type uncharacterized transport system substrate-binding protein
VIVLPHHGGGEPDAFSRITCAAIHRACRGQPPRIVVAVEDPEATHEFAGLGVATIFYPGFLRAALLAHACLDLAAFRVLLGLVRGRLRVQTWPVPPTLRAGTFRDACLAVEVDPAGNSSRCSGCSRGPRTRRRWSSTPARRARSPTRSACSCSRDRTHETCPEGSCARRGWCALAAGPCRAAEAPLRFGSGSKGGNFALLGQALQAELEGGDAAVRLVSEETKGSCENIRRLLEGTLDLALVQYDVAAEAFRASETDLPAGQEDAFGGWMCKISPQLAHGAELRVIAAVSDSAVHMLVRRPVRLDDFAAIGDRGVYIGKDGSGSFETAKVILGAGGRAIDGINLFGGSADESLLAMGRGEVLMMLRTTDPGHPDITKVLDSGLAALGPLPEDVLNRLLDGYPYYRVCPIEPRTTRASSSTACRRCA